ncbi:MAG: type II toxin-antitoxin system YafQ family toxin [Bacillota bacterium]|nr:type II toxin-antitoxin system YafQ family toxin [Bacillota bacterium]
MLKIEFTNQFKKDYKVALKKGCDKKKLEAVIALLANEESLPEKYKDHPLTNSRNFKNVRECHIEPDWLLVYQIVKDILTLRLIRAGSHSDLFK